MATPAFNRTEFQVFEPSITMDFRSMSGMASPLNESPFIAGQPNYEDISTSEGLEGARAAVVAIGLEVAAVLCLCGIWQIWHFIR